MTSPPTRLPAPQPPSAQTVTASDLVRQFGEWQRRAAISPVYILHHRKPQFVLASIEFMQALASQAHRVEAAGLEDVLDALDEPVVLVAPDGMIVAAGRAARAWLGDSVRRGAVLTDALDPVLAGPLGQVVARVDTSGLRETVHLPAPHAGRDRVTLTVEPQRGGVLIVGRTAAAEFG